MAAGLLVAAFALGAAQSGPAASASGAANAGGIVLASSTASGKITVTGTGTVTGTPDQLTLSMGVQTNASSVSDALNQANTATRHVMAALTARGVRKADIQTSNLSIQPRYRDGSPAPVGYQVSEDLTATLRVLSKAGSQIQAAVTAGGNATVVDGVSLNLSDTSGLLAKARAGAIRDAQAKASQFAGALHRPLAGVISVSDQSAVIPFAEPAALGFKSAASVPVSPGKQQVSVQITVVYALG